MSSTAVQQEGPPPPNGRGGLILQTYSAPLPQTLVGKSIFSPRNDTIGQVVGIRDDKMLVSVGQLLGMGERIVVFPREWVQFQGAGDAMVITTSAGRDQIAALPIYAGTVSDLRR